MQRSIEMAILFIVMNNMDFETESITIHCVLRAYGDIITPMQM